MDRLKVKKLRQSAILPMRATPDSAGADLCACIDEPLLLPAGRRVTVPTGVALEIPAGMAGFIFGRSGLGIKHGVVPSNAVGVIDADYRGEVIVGLSNHGDADYLIRPGERIAQLVLLPVSFAGIVQCAELTDTARGTGGFGSTGSHTP